MKFPDRPRAVITGAGSGFGRALALQLAARKARILVADVNAAGAAETARLVRAAGGSAEPVACDVSRCDEVENLAVESERLWGGTDILINNAGVAVAGRVGEIPLADWKWIVDINLWGVVYGCHVFAPRFRSQRSGFLLNVAAAAGFVSLPEMSAYSLTKAAVVSLSETLYGELGPDNVSVTVACPSFFKTNLMDNFRSPGERQRIVAQNFFKKSSMTAEQVAARSVAALESGELFAIPQADAKIAWRLKRASPALYFRTIRNRFYSKFVERKLLEG